MKLLVTTQVVDENNPALGFFVNWLKEIAANCEQVTVICLYKGKYELPANVKVLSLGKETGVSRIKYITNFYKYIWSERKNYDAVFVHMNQIYVILGGIFWRLTGKKIGFWYVHKQVTRELKIAEKLTNVVFTAAKESFNVPSKKVQVVGHGIDTKAFINTNRKAVFSNPEKIIISAGRITPIKDLVTLVRAVKILKDSGENLKVRLIGPTTNDADNKYKQEVIDLATNLGILDLVTFTGSIPEQDKLSEMWTADMHVNLCPTGGLDKAVIESACAGDHSFVANQAFRKHYGDLADDYLFDHGNAQMLADKIEKMLKLPADVSTKKVESLQKTMIDNFDVKALIKNMLKYLNDTGK